MTKRNLTIQLDIDVIHKARILAVQRSTSVSKLVAAEIERMVGEEEEYERAKRHALKSLETGFALGGEPYPSREELYDR